jgi:anti-sigma factor RsiW
VKLPFGRREHTELPCSEVGRLLQAYLDRELEEQVLDAIARHLEDCRRCGLEVEAYDGIKRALRRGGMTNEDASLLRLRSFAADLAAGAVLTDGHDGEPEE